VRVDCGSSNPQGVTGVRSLEIQLRRFWIESERNGNRAIGLPLVARGVLEPHVKQVLAGCWNPEQQFARRSDGTPAASGAFAVAGA
jgi:hypothetical protein